MEKARKKIVVAMSGGVDSSVAAALLVREGHEVIGAFMKNWSETADPCTGECAWKEERADALRVAALLGIPFETFDFEREYGDAVVEYMTREYAAGRTPNPDVMCNKFVKFDPFMKRALGLGADAIATGHYARVEDGERGRGGEGECRLLAGIDGNKDQSYFLHQLSQDQLAHTLFPVGHLRKSEVRSLAREFGLPTAEKKDSQGICFIGKVDLAAFLGNRIAGRPGPIVSVGGSVVGRHRGIAPFTIGQRHGMGLGGGAPYFVVEKDAVRNTLVVSRDDRDLLATSIRIGPIHWIAGREPALPIRCRVRIRYRQPLQEATVTGDGIAFDAPQRAVSPGQFAVLYDGETCLGGAVIERAGGAA
jgi:tRNA-specific 2-thiouridylase